MGWTTPTTRATGYLVTAANWNTDIVDNLKYLKGSAGQVDIEDDIVLASGKELVADKVFTGPYRALHLGSVRELSYCWETVSLDSYAIDDDSGNGGNVDDGGSGQLILKVDLDDGSGSYAYVANLAAQHNGLATPVNASRNPYMRCEFSLNSNSAYAFVFIGFRQTVASSMPTGTNYAGIRWVGGGAPGSWVADNSDGANIDQDVMSPLTAGVRHTVEIMIIGGTSVEIYVDGTLEHSGTSYLPTGDLHWSVNNLGTGDPVANNGLLTVGKIIIQENLS
jgi:hypothetical protein